MHRKPNRRSKLIRAAGVVCELLENRRLFSAQAVQTSTIPVGNQPDAVTVGNILGDGNADIVTANYSDNTVTILPGNGDGTFGEPITLAVGDGPSAVTVGYLGFNYGSHMDIITTNAKDNTISILVNNGNGTFAPAETIAVGKDPDAVALCNIGGYEDIVVANKGDNTVTVLEPQYVETYYSSTYTFSSSLYSATFSVGSKPDAVAIGMFADSTYSGDQLGIVTANAGDGTVSVLLANISGDGPNIFEPAETLAVGNDPTSIAIYHNPITDFGDLIVANAGDNTVSILHCTGGGNFEPAETYSVGNQPQAVVVGDNNYVGTEVIATANADGTVSLLEANPAGGFYAVQTISAGAQPVAIAAGDFTGDGFSDFVVANAGDGTVTVLHCQPPADQIFNYGVYDNGGRHPYYSVTEDMVINREPQPGQSGLGSGGNSSVLNGDAGLLSPVSDPLGQQQSGAAVAALTDPSGDLADDQGVTSPLSDNLSLLSLAETGVPDSSGAAAEISAASPQAISIPFTAVATAIPSTSTRAVPVTLTIADKPSGVIITTTAAQTSPSPPVTKAGDLKAANAVAALSVAPATPMPHSNRSTLTRLLVSSVAFISAFPPRRKSILRRKS